MACHEIAALRVSLLQILGINDANLLQHELAELGDAAEHPGPIRMLSQSKDFRSLRYAFELCRSELEEKLSQTPAGDKGRPYLQTLAVLNRKIESDLANLAQYCEQFFEDLETVHDHMHVVYPAE
jgi:hypothetical protein